MPMRILRHEAAIASLAVAAPSCAVVVLRVPAPRRRAGPGRRPHGGACTASRRRPRIVYAEPIDAPAPQAAGPVHARAEEQDVPAARAGGSARIDRRLSERRRHLPQRVLAVGAATVRPRPVSRRRHRRRAPSRSAGIYRVFCNIHPQMSAIILVAPTPLVALAGPDGRFMLDLPPGRYRLTALSERRRRCRWKSRPAGASSPRS